MQFKLYKGALNVAIFIDFMIDFMKRLIKDAKQKVFLIVNNLRVHHAKAVHALDAKAFAHRLATNQQTLRTDIRGAYHFIVCGSGTSEGRQLSARLIRR
jgi:hypothetical protein